MRNKFTILVFMALFQITAMVAQEKTVTGTVTSSGDGMTLPGVNVIIKGTKQGAVTDMDGKYSVNVSETATLLFSSVGFVSKEVLVGSQTQIDISLQENLEGLDEVVVTAFGIEKQTKSLGYSVQSVDAEDLNLNGQTNALESLQGRVAGLQINRTSGSAGGGVDILIRGVSSVDPGRDNQPLIIVDGIALNNDTFSGNVNPSAGSNATGSSEQFAFSNRAGDINPEDIESYNVLKGAAATALYGIRASNGAIVITTKSGKIGKPRINLNLSTTVREVVKTPELQKTYREGNRTTRAPGAIENPDSETGFDFFGTTFWSWGVPYTDDSYTFSDGTVVDLSNDRFYDPNDSFFETGINTQINFNISGASEKFDYFFSMGNSDDQGTVPNTNYTKTNFRFKGGYKVSDEFEITSSVTYANSGGKRGNGGDKSIFSSLVYWPTSFNINDYKNRDGSQRNVTRGIVDNPRYFAETSNLEDDVNRWIGNTTFNWAPYEWVTFSYSAQVDNYSDLRSRFVPRDLDVGTQVGGFLVKENINFTGLESNFLATFTKDISTDFKTILTVGHQLSDIKTEYSFIRGEGLNVPGIKELSNTLNTFAGNQVTQLRNLGVFGDFRLEYKDRIFLSVTGRNDWVSVLPTSNRSFFYPSFSLSTLFHDLIDPDQKILTFAKLRASWAQVGKGPNYGQVGQFFIKDDSFPFNGASGFSASTSIGDLNIIPEKSNTFEIGTDLRMFKNRVRVDYSYYKSKVNNQIFPVGAAFSSGLSTVVRNAGDYETWGHELLVILDVFKREDFQWEAIVNWSTTGGKVTSIPSDLDEIVFFDDLITAKAKVGDELGSLYGWVFQTAPNGERLVGPEGKWIVTGSNNDDFYYLGGNQKVKVGNAFPDYILSLTNNITWKNLNLNFLVEYKSGGDLYDRGFRNALRNGTLKETEFRDQTTVLNGVMADGNGGFVPNTQEVEVTANNFYRDFDNYNTASEVLLQDASWVKLRSIGMTYSLPTGIISKLKLSRASVTASANNIILWTAYEGFDPEGSQFSAGSNIHGFTGLTVPLTQSYSLGLNFEF